MQDTDFTLILEDLYLLMLIGLVKKCTIMKCLEPMRRFKTNSESAAAQLTGVGVVHR